MKQPTIFFDLDGVLANFDKRAGELLGTDNIYRWEFVYGPEAFWKVLNARGDFFSSIELMPGAERLIAATELYPRAILTALPKTGATQADTEKRAWVRYNLSHTLQTVITCTTTDKPKHCSPGDILIDDRAVNKEAWKKAGGNFIIHTDVESTIQQLKDLGIG